MAELEPDDSVLTFLEMLTTMNEDYPNFTRAGLIINTMSVSEVLKLLHVALEFSLGVMMSEAEGQSELVPTIISHWREEYVKVMEDDV